MKNYLFCLRRQLRLYGEVILTAAFIYGIMLYFQCCDPLCVNANHIVQFVFYSLIYVFLGAYFYKYFDSKKKRVKNFK